MPKRTNASWACDLRALAARRAAAFWLRDQGFSFKEISVAMRTTPEKSRGDVAKQRRIYDLMDRDTRGGVS